MRGSAGSRAEYNAGTLVVCFVMIIILSGAAIYIVDYGLSNNEKNGLEPTGHAVFYELYAEEMDVAGTLTVYNGTQVFVILNVTDSGAVFNVPNHPIGGYSVYYIGSNNSINFGPVAFVVLISNTILIDQEYFGVRLTVKTL